MPAAHHDRAADGGSDALRSWISADFGLELAAVEPVGHGADAAAAVWRATGTDGAEYAIKWSGGGSPAGLLLPARLAELGIDGVPAPVRTVAGTWWSDRAGRRLSLQPWLPGARALDTGMTREQWTAYGALLAAVHAVPVTDPVARRLPAEDHRPATALAAVRSVDDRLAAGAGASAGTDADADAGVTAGDELAAELATAWRPAAGLLAALAGRATALGARLRDRPTPAVVCHTDGHQGNVLLGPGPAVWLIDWDDATLAPPERDLMFVVGGLPGFSPAGQLEWTWFTAGYGTDAVDTERLAYYRSVRALWDIAELAAAVLDPGGGPGERATALRTVRAELAGRGLAGLAVAGEH